MSSDSITRDEFNRLKNNVDKLITGLGGLGNLTEQVAQTHTETTFVPENVPVKKRELSEYNRFMSEEPKKIRERTPGMPMKEAFKKAAEKWNERKKTGSN